MTTLFICAIEDNTVLLCEKHAKVFEMTAMTAGVPHTIVECDEDDVNGRHCHACDLVDTLDEMNRPKIIMPGEL